MPTIYSNSIELILQWFGQFVVLSVSLCLEISATTHIFIYCSKPYGNAPTKTHFSCLAVSKLEKDATYLIFQLKFQMFEILFNWKCENVKFKCHIFTIVFGMRAHQTHQFRPIIVEFKTTKSTAWNNSWRALNLAVVGLWITYNSVSLNVHISWFCTFISYEWMATHISYNFWALLKCALWN